MEEPGTTEKSLIVESTVTKSPTIINYSPKCSNSACAAKLGHLLCLKYMKERGCNFGPKTYLHLLQNPDLPIDLRNQCLEWLVSNQVPFNAKVINGIARIADFQLLNYFLKQADNFSSDIQPHPFLYQGEPLINSGLILQAAIGGDIEFLKTVAQLYHENWYGPLDNNIILEVLRETHSFENFVFIYEQYALPAIKDPQRRHPLRIDDIVWSRLSRASNYDRLTRQTTLTFEDDGLRILEYALRQGFPYQHCGNWLVTELVLVKILIEELEDKAMLNYWLGLLNEKAEEVNPHIIRPKIPTEVREYLLNCDHSLT